MLGTIKVTDEIEMKNHGCYPEVDNRKRIHCHHGSSQSFCVIKPN